MIKFSLILLLIGIIFVLAIVLFYYLPISHTNWSANTSISCGGSCSNFSYNGNSISLNFTQHLLFKTNIYYAQLSSSGIGKWMQINDIVPFNFSCIASGGYFYCASSSNNDYSSSSPTTTNPYIFRYSAKISNGTIGTWTPLTKSASLYQKVIPFSCTVFNNYIYCFGNYTYFPAVAYPVYYAKISNGSISNWTPTTGFSFNTNPSEISCVAYNWHMYCYLEIIDGGNVSVPFKPYFYYANITSNGALGVWKALPTPSVYHNVYDEISGCLANNGYLICTNTFNRTLYTQILSDGSIVRWMNTTNYPQDFYPPCGIFNNRIYCIGDGSFPSNVTYYANLSSSGIGQWLPTTPLPTPQYYGSCPVSGGYIYCTTPLVQRDIYNVSVYVYREQTSSQQTSFPYYPFAQCSNCSIISTRHYNVVSPLNYYGLNATIPSNINFGKESLYLKMDYSLKPNGIANTSAPLAIIFKRNWRYS